MVFWGLCFQDEGLDVSLFQKPAKLHLTLGTLVLMSRKEVVSRKGLMVD